jgi:sortase A
LGFSVLLYPALSSFFNAGRQTRVITQYDAVLAEAGCEVRMGLLDAAHEWNRLLRVKENRYLITGEERAEYRTMLDITGSGIMGHIEIEAIGVRLPIYHGTDDNVLQIGAGHIEWSSLPVGGPGTHSVITAHNGLPTSELFTKLDRLIYGDIFVLRVLGEELIYRVNQILVVEPSDTSALFIEDGMDYCTLITCTPYANNSHRLLVRGTECECSCRCCVITWLLVVWLLVLTILVVWLFIRRRKKSGRGSNDC